MTKQIEQLIGKAAKKIKKYNQHFNTISDPLVVLHRSSVTIT